MTEYGLLRLLWLWALRAPRPAATRLALVITLAYAASDELHGVLRGLPARVAARCLIDAAGAGVAAAAWVARTRRDASRQVSGAPGRPRPG